MVVTHPTLSPCLGIECLGEGDESSDIGSEALQSGAEADRLPGGGGILEAPYEETKPDVHVRLGDRRRHRVRALVGASISSLDLSVPVELGSRPEDRCQVQRPRRSWTGNSIRRVAAAADPGPKQEMVILQPACASRPRSRKPSFQANTRSSLQSRTPGTDHSRPTTLIGEVNAIYIPATPRLSRM